MTTLSMKKPIPLRIIFILNALMMVLPFVFAIIFKAKNVSLGGLQPIHMVYTGIAYIVSFALLVFFIKKKNRVGLRIMFLVNFLIAWPTKAYLGFLVAVVSLAISFTKKVRDYFAS